MNFEDALIYEKKYDDFMIFFNEVLNPFGSIGQLLFSADFVFRGENSNQYDLVPKALRKLCDIDKKILYQLQDNISPIETEYEQYEYEQAVINRFAKYANQQGLLLPNRINDYIVSLSATYVDVKEEKMVWPEKEQIELFSLAQHYGIPTRLLDFSFDILIALFFAVNTHIDAEYVRLYALRVTELQRFGDKISFHVPQYAHNPNLRAQKGVMVYLNQIMDFSTFEGKETPIICVPFDKAMSDNFKQAGRLIMPYMYKLDLHKNIVKDVKSYLFKLGYNYSKVFPGFASIKDTIMQELLLSEE